MVEALFPLDGWDSWCSWLGWPLDQDGDALENRKPGGNLNLQFQEFVAVPWGCSPTRGLGKTQEVFLLNQS